MPVEMVRSLLSNLILEGGTIMVRSAEQANVTNPAAERRFDSKNIFYFVGAAILLLLVFLYVGSRLFSYGETVNTEQKQQQTQESDKRAAP